MPTSFDDVVQNGPQLQYTSPMLLFSVTAMDFHIRERERFSTLGCLDGFVKCATVDTENNSQSPPDVPYLCPPHPSTFFC